MKLTPFTSTADSVQGLGAEALLYIMAHGHTISIPDHALYFAEKVAIVSIASSEIPAPVLRDVNRAIDLIAQSIRFRERLDRDSQQAPAPAPSTLHPRPNEGPMAPILERPIARPPAGHKVDIAF